MSKENVEIVRNAYAALAEHGVEALEGQPDLASCERAAAVRWGTSTRSASEAARRGGGR